MPFITDEELEAGKIPAEQTTKDGGEPGFLSRVGTSFKERGGQFGDIFSETAKGEISPVETGIRTVGTGIGAITDIVGEAITPIIKPALEKVANTDAGRDLFAALSMGKDAYDQIKNSSKEAKRAAETLEGVINISSIFPAAKIAQTTGKVALNQTLKTTKNVVDFAKKTPLKTKDFAKTGIETAKENILEPAAEKLNPLLPAVETEIKKSTKGDINKYFDVAKAGAGDYSKPSALDVVGEKAGEAVQSMKKQLGTYGKQIGGVPQLQAGIDMPKVINTAKTTLNDLLKSRAGMQLNRNNQLINLPGRLGKLDAEEMKLINFVNGKLQSLANNPNFQAVDDFVNNIQNELFGKVQNQLIPKNSNAEAIIKGIVAKVNKAQQNISPSSKRLTYSNAKYSEIKDVYDTLNKLLGSKGKNAGALMKRVFSPSDAGTKKLFSKVKEITGVDLVKEATLAKYAMESIGDARSASILEKLNILTPEIPSTWLIKAAKYATEKSYDPLKQALKKAK